MARAGRRLRSGSGLIVSALYTVGHGTLAAEAFVDLVRQAKIAAVIDVRRFPASRRHPQFAREAMQAWLGDAGIAYRWEEPLGGRRRSIPGSHNLALHNSAFRGYADYMESDDFRAALERTLDEARSHPTAVMCAESLWWHCHRRLIADAAQLLHDVTVEHLMHTGKVAPHRPTDGVRLAGDALVYDAGAARLL